MNHHTTLSSFAFCLSLTLILTACQPASETIRARIARDTHPAAPAADISQLVADNNAFAFDLYHQIASEHDGNLIFSPYSISQAFAMLYAGARGDTEQQIAEVLHFSLPQDRLHPAFNALDLKLIQSAAVENKAELTPSSAIWAQRGSNFGDAYLATLATEYGAGIHTLDFQSSPDASRQQINQWVNDETNGRITELLPDGAVDAGTRMLLVNALYFNADWSIPFIPELTGNGTFHRLDGTTLNASMMVEYDGYRPYADGDGWQAVELAYQGSISMMIMLPESGQFPEFEQSLDAALLQAIHTSLREESILTLGVPRWEFRSSFDASSALQNLGMVLPFSSSADFTGVTTSDDLFVTGLIHEASIAVGEEGEPFELAAEPPVDPIEMIVDRPYIFAIYDTDTSAILFLGRVLDPSQ
jgi:serpin B